MAPPPKYLIQRKLIKSIVNKVVPQRPLIPMDECWKRFGIGSPKCADQELMYDFANTEVISFKQRMKDLGLKELVMEEVKRPVYHFEVKGRFYAYRKKFEDTIKFMNHL